MDNPVQDTDKPIPEYTPQEFWDKRVEHDPDQNEFWQVFFYIDEYSKGTDIHVTETQFRYAGMFHQIISEEFSNTYQNLIDIKDHIKIDNIKGFLYEYNSILDWGFIEDDRIVPDTTFKGCYVPAGLAIFSEMEFCYYYLTVEGEDIVEKDKRFAFLNTHGELTKDVPLLGYEFDKLARILYKEQPFDETPPPPISMGIITYYNVALDNDPISPLLKIQNGNLYKSYLAYLSYYTIAIYPSDYGVCLSPSKWYFTNDWNDFSYDSYYPDNVFYATDFDISGSLDLIFSTYYQYNCWCDQGSWSYCYAWDIEYTLQHNQQGHYSVITKNTPFLHSKFLNLLLHQDINYTEQSLSIQSEQIHKRLPDAWSNTEGINLTFNVTQVTEHSLFNKTFTSPATITNKAWGFDNNPPLHPNIHEYYYKYTAGSGVRLRYSGVPIHSGCPTPIQDGVIEWTI
jgi:hypothetical protein